MYETKTPLHRSESEGGSGGDGLVSALDCDAVNGIDMMRSESRSN